MTGILLDVRYTGRMMRRNPGFTAIAVLTLALGIGGTTAVFSVVDPLLLVRLPVPSPNELVSISVERPDVRTFVPFTPASFRLPPTVSPAEFERLRARGHSVTEAFLASGSAEYEMADRPVGDPRQEVRVDIVSAGFFPTLHLVPVLGRVFVAGDEAPAAARVAVISHAFWVRSFGEVPQILGNEIALRRRDQTISATIVGVAPPGFAGTDVGELTDIWMLAGPPITRGASPLELGWWTGGRMLARLRPGVDLDEARAELEAIHVQLLQERVAEFGSQLTPGQREAFLLQRLVVSSGARGWGALRTEFGRPLFILMAAVGAVLLIACANVASLLLAQGAARRRELAVCLAVGGSRARLIRQQLTASVTLALVGGALAYFLAAWITRAMVSYVPPLAGAALDFGPNLRVLAFTFGVSLSSAILFGLMPAMRLTRVEPNTTLKNSSPGATSSHQIMSRILIPAQIAVSLVLLVGAGLFLRNLQNLRGIETGFDRDDVIRVQTSGQFDYLPILQRLERVPAVESATAWGTGLLGAGAGMSGPVVVPGFVARAEEELFVPSTRVGPRFFETMGIALVSGREFRADDALPGRNTVVVSQAMARHFFGDRDAVGQRFRLSRRPNADVFEIVGVAEDATYASLRDQAPRTIYFPFDPGRQFANMAVRISGEPATVAAAIAGALKAFDPGLQVTSIRTVNDITEAAILRERLLAQFGTALGGLGLFLACLGLYGTMAYAVTQRTSEIGIRMALGARVATILGMLMREAGGIVGAGVLLGLAGTLVATRAASGLLFGLTATDPSTIVAAVLVLVAAAAVAAYMPARRAARIDPIVALKYE